MKIELKAKPELIASKDQTRSNICHPFLETGTGRLFATDGHRLLVVPIYDIDPKDTSGAVPASALELARKAAKGTGLPADLVANGTMTIGSTLMERPEVTFPLVNDIIDAAPKRGDANTVTIGFNAQYLAGLVKAAGAHDRAVELTVRVEPTPDGKFLSTLEAMRVDFSAPAHAGTFAVLMPVRLSSDCELPNTSADNVSAPDDRAGAGADC